jgi:hypothetical protein
LIYRYYQVVQRRHCSHQQQPRPQPQQPLLVVVQLRIEHSMLDSTVYSHPAIAVVVVVVVVVVVALAVENRLVELLFVIVLVAPR